MSELLTAARIMNQDDGSPGISCLACPSADHSPRATLVKTHPAFSEVSRSSSRFVTRFPTCFLDEFGSMIGRFTRVWRGWLEINYGCCAINEPRQASLPPAHRVTRTLSSAFDATAWGVAGVRSPSVLGPPMVCSEMKPKEKTIVSVEGHRPSGRFLVLDSDHSRGRS